MPAVPVSTITTGTSAAAAAAELSHGSTSNPIAYQRASTLRMRRLSSRMFSDINGARSLEKDADFNTVSSPSSLNEKSTSNTVLGKKILNGFLLTPVILISPLYAIGFGVLGHDTMWAFSKWIYTFANSSESCVNDHFSRMQRFLATGTSLASQKSRSYRIHPTFAGLSLISTAILAFVDPSNINKIISRKWLLVANTCICFISALSARALENTMLGNASTKKWNSIQGNLSIFFAALALSSSWLGNLMVHLNWAILFCGGFLERTYGLCVLSQFRINDRSTYIKYYSPMITVATIGSIPLGIATYFIFGSILPS